MYSKRIKNLGQSPIRKLIPYTNEAVKKGKNIFYLNIGQPDIETPTDFFDNIKQFSSNVLSYAPSQGIPTLIEAIRNYYERHNSHFNTDEIMITNGGSEALLFSMMVLADPEDEILIPEPFYTNYKSFVKSVNVNIVPIPTSIENDFHLPEKQLIQNLITPKTKAIIINSPGNPTGVIYSKEELIMIDELIKENDLFLISDEVYRDFIFDDIKYISVAEVMTTNRYAIVDSTSKRFSACGARIGSIASKDEDFLGHFLKLCQARLSSPTLEQYASTALYNMDDSYLNNAKLEYEKRRNTAFKALDKISGITYSKSKGAFYTMVKLPVKNAEDFIIWMISNYDIDNNTLLVTPCEDFYATPDKGLDEIRLAYVLESEKLEKCIEILDGALKEYNKSLRADIKFAFIGK